MTILTRRGLLKTAAIAGASGIGLSTMGKFAGWAAAKPEPVMLQTARIQAKLMDVGQTRNVLTYGDQGMPSVLRMKKGEPFAARLVNAIDDPTTIHWHGVRVPNKMDGVPFLVQPYVYTGDHFDYAFTPPDAGTFWYHPHQRSFEQVGRGLYAALIVEERHPIEVDRDLTWILDDWRLDSSGQLAGFGNRMDELMAGQVGNTITINGRLPQPLLVRTGERIRLRLINAANARIFGLNFGEHRPRIIAIDGQPVRPHEPEGPIVIGPAMRLDLIFDMMGRPGSRAAITDDFYKGGLEYRLTDIAYSNSPLRGRPLDAPVGLPRNPLPEPDLRGADRHEVVFGGGMMSMMSGNMMGSSMMDGGMMAWTINGVSSIGHVHKPMLALQRGRTAVLDLRNETAWWHPIHLHGHSFRVLSRNGKPTALKEWQDTVLIPPQERAEIAFVADNPGNWMIHCHILEHQDAGMMAMFRIA